LSLVRNIQNSESSAAIEVSSLVDLEVPEF